MGGRGVSVVGMEKSKSGERERERGGLIGLGDRVGYGVER